VYLMSGEQQDTLQAYQREILPAFKDSVRA
jgi:hypothetical protein